MSGWAGKIAFVDLSAREVRFVPTSRYRDLIGGRGIATQVAAELIPEGTGPLDPGNVIALMTGPLTATSAPSSSRLSAAYKNVLTGGFGSSNVGGSFAAELKCSGVDGIVITGRSAEPVYLVAADGAVRFRPAGHLWGKGTMETTQAIRSEIGDDRAAVAAIGPAGENRCGVACVIVDGGKSASYGGIGAIFGSKMLKAVAARGTFPVVLANPVDFDRCARRAVAKVLGAPGISMLRRYGTIITGGGGLDGSLPQAVRNLSDGYWPAEKTIKINPLLFKELHERETVASPGCPIACGRKYEFTPRSGSVAAAGCDAAAARRDAPARRSAAPHPQKIVFQGLEANAVSNFGPLCDCDDPVAILESAYVCNELGLDWDGAAAAVAWALEAAEAGILDSSETGDLHLNWGNANVLPELLRRMACREGLGELLADGPLAAADRIGRGSELAMNVKGAPLRESWLQTDIFWALGIALATRGSGHLNGAVKLGVLRSSPEDVLARMREFGLRLTFPVPTIDETAAAVAWFENFKAVVDSLGVCYFTSWWADPQALGPDDYAEMFAAATGIPATAGELLAKGGLIQNTERAFNARHAGLGREQDKLPARLYRVAISAGKYEGAKLDEEVWDRLLDSYYALRGYDLRTGRPPAGLLNSLAGGRPSARPTDSEPLGL